MRIILLFFLLIIIGTMDTRQVDAQTCLPTRLEIGSEARVTPGASNRIRSEPSINAEQVGQIPAREVVTLLEGARCVDNILWWRIDYGGIEGWTAEANAEEYFLEPYIDSSATTTTDTESCTAEVRLQVGAYGQVSSTAPSRLRDEPEISAEQVGQVNPIDIFQVVDGPICANSFNWWQVEVDGLIGWLAEGDEDTYYVEVVTDSSLIGLPSTTEPTLVTYAVSWNADASRLALATSAGVFIYDADNWSQSPYILDDGIVALDIEFSPIDPNLLVINSSDTSISDTFFRFRAYILSDEDDEIIFERELLDGPLGGDIPAEDFAFSDNGRYLSFGGNSFDIFDTESWTRINYLEITVEAGNHYQRLPIYFTDLSATAQHGFGVVNREVVQLYDFTISHTPSFGEVDPRISEFNRGGRAQEITSLKLSPDGMQVIVGDITGSLQMWDVLTNERLSFIRAENQTSISNQINDIAFHANGEILATAESNPIGIVRIFEAETLEPVTVFGADEARTVTYAVSYSPDGAILLAVMDDVLYLLDTTNYTVISQISICIEGSC